MTAPPSTETPRRTSSETNRLLPCPFCGGEAYQVQIGNAATKSRGYEIGCRDCRVKITDMVIRKDLDWIKPRNIANWNKRPGSAAQPPRGRDHFIAEAIAESAVTPSPGPRAWTPDQFWEYVSGLAGEFE